MSDLSERLKPWADRIERSAAHGNRKALQVISLYRLHATQPHDPGAAGLCSAAFDDWRKSSALSSGERGND